MASTEVTQRDLSNHATGKSLIKKENKKAKHADNHNKKLCVLYIQSNTTIFHLVVQWVCGYIGCNYMFRP